MQSKVQETYYLQMLTYRVICNLPYTEAMLALMHTLILLLGSFLLSGRRSAIYEKKWLH